MTPILVVASLTLAASFLCSLFEAALYAITPARLALQVRNGVRGARRLAQLREHIEEPIAAILTVNTIAHTVGAAWCGAMVGDRYGSAALGLFATVFTVLVLALTEIVPKSLGVRYAARLGTLIAWPIQLMIWSVWPIVWLARRSMTLLTGPRAVDGPTEDEVLVTSRMAADHGMLRSEEHTWVRNALRLDRVTAGELRTPRTVVESLPADLSLGELRRGVDRWVHSRVPVTEAGHPDRVLGLALRREVFDALLEPGGEERTLRELVHPIQFVPESTPAHELLQRFVAQRSHMFAVVDEYGGFEGVVTLEDVLECLLGAEIVDEHDEVADLQTFARERAEGLALDREGSGEPDAGSEPDAGGERDAGG